MATGETIITPFNHQHGFPPDLRMQVQDLNARDTISPTVRWEGMPVYVINEQATYRLVGGITNPDWQLVDGGAASIRTPIDGDYASTGAMIADQGVQASGYIYYAAGTYYQYLGTTNGDLTDYRGIISSADVLTLISAALNITSDTDGTTDAQWINSTGITRSVTSEEVTFIGAPSAGNFRYSLVQGEDDGSVTVKEGTEGTEGGVTPPVKDSNTVVLSIVLWNDAGEAEEQPVDSGDFRNDRLATEVAPNTTGKYAKLWEGNLSKNGNYQIHLAYGAPSSDFNWSTGDAGKSGVMVLNFLVNSSRNIIGTALQFETIDSNSESADFELIQIAGNKAALYHKSTQYWMRLQFRVLFSNSAIKNSDFFSGESYGALPTLVDQWSSSPFAGSGISDAPSDGVTYGRKDAGWVDTYPAAVERENNTVLFDKDYIIGNAAARTGNILFDFTGAKLGATTEMRHNDAGAFTFPTEAQLMFDSGDISTSADNYYMFVITDITGSSEVVKVFHAMVGGVS